MSCRACWGGGDKVERCFYPALSDDTYQHQDLLILRLMFCCWCRYRRCCGYFDFKDMHGDGQMNRHSHGNFWDKIQPRRNGWYNLVINRNYLTSHRMLFCKSVFSLSKGQTDIRFSLSILSLSVKFFVFMGNTDTAHFFFPNLGKNNYK